MDAESALQEDGASDWFNKPNAWDVMLGDWFWCGTRCRAYGQTGEGEVRREFEV